MIKVRKGIPPPRVAHGRVRYPWHELTEPGMSFVVEGDNSYEKVTQTYWYLCRYHREMIKKGKRGRDPVQRKKFLAMKLTFRHLAGSSAGVYRIK